LEIIYTNQIILWKGDNIITNYYLQQFYEQTNNDNKIVNIDTKRKILYKFLH